MMLALVLPLFCAGCKRVSPPMKPERVPYSAVWAGASDGGSFVFCDIDPVKDVNHCKVWNDFNGKPVESGEYRLLKEGRAANQTELVFSWAERAGWIGLEHGLVLANLNSPHAR